MKRETCRYCERTFTPAYGKPGLRNECLPCLIERANSQVKVDFEAKFIAAFPERARGIKDLGKMLRDLPTINDDNYDAIMEKLMIEALNNR